ncbi:hypothetical protein [Chitinophaga parva]|nr:hypothetical protein [Chitinophaga parva]
MKIVYRIILAVLGLFGIFLCGTGVYLALKAIGQGQLAAGNKHRVLTIITCIQPFAMLLVAICAALALRRELKTAPHPPR